MNAQNNSQNGWVHGLVAVSLLLFGLTGMAVSATINVPGDQPTIQAAINAAAAGDTVFVSNGNYVLGATLNVTKGITIEGESEAGVVIDASSRGTGYGIYVEANNATLKKFTLLPPVVPASLGTSSGGGFAIHCSFNHTVPYSSLTNLALADITIQDGNRAAFDIHGYDGVTLTGLTAQNSAYGNGIQITGCTDVTITGATVSGNAWGGIAFYASKSTYLNRPCSSITYDMAANPDVDQPVYVEDDYALVNSVTIAGASYLIYNNYNPGTAAMWMYTDGTEADAVAIAQALNAKYAALGFNTLSQITNESTGNLVIAPALSTIQAAIDAASPGDTIELAAGTFTENFFISNRVNLVGAGSGTDGTVIAAAAGDSRIGVVNLVASGLSDAEPILLKDFRIATSARSGISVGRFYEGTGTSVQYVKLDNVKVFGTNSNPNTEQERGLYVDLTSSLQHLVVTGCAFDDVTYGWYIQKQVSADTSTVRYVDVSNTSFSHNNLKGIYAEKLSDATFTGCTVDGNGFRPDGVPSYFLPWMCGVDINLKAGTYANISFIDCEITNNALGGAKEGVGITVKARDDGGTYGPFPATVDNVLIQGCTITGNERGVRFGEPGKNNATPTNVVVSECLLYGNVQTYAGTDGSAYGDAINMTAASSMNFSANWWGQAEGPLSGQIYGPHSLNTFYADSGLTMLVAPVVQVDDDFTPATAGWGQYAFTNVQQGVTATALGGTLQVHPGSYTQQVEISQNLTLQGTAPGVVIQSPVTLAKSFTTSAVNKPVVYVHDAMSVTLSNVVVDGLFQGGANYRFMGIAYHNAGGAVLASEVKNIANNPPNGSQHGIGVGVYNVDAAARTFALLDSYLHDCQKNCTVFNGDNLTVDIRRNRVFGAGPIDYIAQNGIQISYGATGTVADNIVSGFDYTPGTWASSAIMNYEGGNVLFENNIVTLSDFGLYIYNSAGSVLTGNSLTGNDYSVVSYATVPIVAENNWWGTPIGPVTEGIYGDVDAEPWLAAKPAHANALYLEASDESLFIKPGESIIVDMNVANLTTNVNACQAMLGYSSTYFDDPTGGAVQAGGGVWDQLIWDIWRDAVGTPGEIDTAIGVDADGAVGTTADGTVAIVTLTSRTNVEGITQMVFRPDADPDPGLTESTFLASITGDPVWPAKVHSCNLVIDGTAPVMDYTNITAVENQPLLGDVSVKDCSNTVYQGTVRISVIASDALAGLTNGVPTIQLVNGGVTNTPVFVGPTAADEFTCEWVVDPATPNGIWTATVTATDYAGNETQQTFTLCVNRNQISGYVQSEGFVGRNRVVTFVATGGASTKTWNQTLTFTGDTAAFALTDVPDGTTGLSAKTAWSLRSRLPVTPDSGEAIASFEDADMLRGGDIDNSNSVNVLDYSKLKVNWLTTNPVGDIDGNGSVGASDYSLMRLNWFQVGDTQ